ncbi:hypothetical protein CONPUDRAFT_145197 [Coniophora puteana RWD-64-598 SS2]|uniref:Uncharacterized protein n=1 Tax=Coniophora puteana (strain RWD-64-598) TaxID=741705 RepID=A0A5M3MJL7_CONPW|nr:uncharacterized protein CONPUDRAFT_145197 [Coniophora puteana RWD-64-598 SS2]EIW78994.1 hypothetical protein CONPUDRAFT_145197 [Coniophora puteana RWD-64-598 SS2]
MSCIPSPNSADCVQVYHASLRDYVLDPSRSKEFHVRAAESHGRLLFLCLTVLMKELKKDILGLGNSVQRQTEISGFHNRRDELNSKPLRYAVMYWTYHLKKAECDEKLCALLFAVVKTRLLCLVEVLSLLDQLDAAPAMLSDGYDVVKTCRLTLSSALEDAMESR